MSELYERYWSVLLDKAVRVLDNGSTARDSTAQDAVQEVFISLWKNRDSLNIERVSPYLHTALKYRVISHLRREKAYRMKLADAGQELAVDTTREDVHLNELRSELDAGIQALPEKCGVVFKMSRFERMSNREIANRLDISVRTVENHISNALKKLRRHLKSASWLLLSMLIYVFRGLL